MSKGVRAFTVLAFAATLPQLPELGGKAFRRSVLDAVRDEFGLTELQAAPHYNFALKQQRLADPNSVKGLGRKEGKKGGRKVLHPVTVIKSRTGEVVADGVSRGKAKELIIKASKKKSAKLTIKQDDAVEA